MSINKLKDESEVPMSGGLGNIEQELSSNLGSIYHDPKIKKAITRELGIGPVKLEDNVTFVYSEKVPGIYKKYDIVTKECGGFAGFTAQFKKIIELSLREDCATAYPHLRSLESWESDEDSKKLDILLQYDLLSIMNDFVSKLGVPNVGYIKKDSDNSYVSWARGKTYAFWIPYTIAGKYVRVRFSPGSPKTSFDTPDDRACPVVLLHPAEIEKPLSE